MIEVGRWMKRVGGWWKMVSEMFWGDSADGSYANGRCSLVVVIWTNTWKIVAVPVQKATLISSQKVRNLPDERVERLLGRHTNVIHQHPQTEASDEVGLIHHADTGDDVAGRQVRIAFFCYLRVHVDEVSMELHDERGWAGNVTWLMEPINQKYRILKKSWRSFHAQLL